MKTSIRVNGTNHELEKRTIVRAFAAARDGQ